MLKISVFGIVLPPQSRVKEPEVAIRMHCLLSDSTPNNMTAAVALPVLVVLRNLIVVGVSFSVLWNRNFFEIPVDCAHILPQILLYRQCANIDVYILANSKKYFNEN